MKKDMKKLAYWQREARSLMLKHNEDGKLGGWSFDYDNAVRRLGCCHHSDKAISLSWKLTQLEADDTRITNTILHEIAHALVGAGKGHGRVWKSKFISLGGNGARCSATSAKVEPKFIATCPVCGAVARRFKAPKRQTSCGNCCNVFSRDRLLIFTINPKFGKDDFKKKDD